MGYQLPSEVPAWRVDVFSLAISIPYAAAKVGWQPSKAHRSVVFKTRESAVRHASYVESRAKWSLVPIKWRGDVIQVTRKPDFFDRMRAKLNIKPIWERVR